MFTVSLTEPSGKTPVRGGDGETLGFYPSSPYISKSPLKAPLHLLTVVPALRILLFPVILYCLF